MQCETNVIDWEWYWWSSTACEGQYTLTPLAAVCRFGSSGSWNCGPPWSKPAKRCEPLKRKRRSSTVTWQGDLEELWAKVKLTAYERVAVAKVAQFKLNAYRRRRDIFRTRKGERIDA